MSTENVLSELNQTINHDRGVAVRLRIQKRRPSVAAPGTQAGLKSGSTVEGGDFVNEAGLQMGLFSSEV